MKQLYHPIASLASIFTQGGEAPRTRCPRWIGTSPTIIFTSLVVLGATPHFVSVILGLNGHVLGTTLALISKRFRKYVPEVAA